MFSVLLYSNAKSIGKWFLFVAVGISHRPFSNVQ